MAAQDIVNQQSAYADAAISTGTAFANTLAQYLNFEPIIITGLPDAQYPNRYSSITSAAVRPDALTFNQPSAAEPVLVETAIRELGDILVPTFSDPAPVLSFPTAPSGDLPAAPGMIGVGDVEIPTAPTFSFPTAVELSPITLPEAPSVNVPSFDETLPVPDFAVPTAVFSFAEAEYRSLVLDELKVKLLDQLLNGGYGIEDQDESGIWQRAREREDIAAAARGDELYRRFAERGFQLPPGELGVALDVAAQAHQNKVSDLSRDVMLKRGDLYVENRKFTIQEARQLENVLIQYHGSVQERALNAAKATLEAGIQLFNAAVAKYNAQLDTYKAYGQVYETRVRAILASVDIYKTQVEAKRVEADIQRASVENYRAQLEGVNTLATIYRTQMEAANVRAAIERLRIEAFRGLVDAYQSQVQAKTAEFGMFEARIRGETAKVQAYEAQVNAYRATVEGAKAKSDIELGRLRGDIDTARNRVDVFNAQIGAYRAKLEAQLAGIRALVDKHGAQTALYNVDMQSVMAAQNFLAQLTKLEVDERVANANIAIKNAEFRYKSVLDAVGVRSTFSSHINTLLSSQITAALGALNAVSSVSA